MVLSKKAVQFVSGGIISSYITTHYLEQSKHLGVFKHSTKLNVQRTLNDLIKIEQDYFNETENVDEAIEDNEIDVFPIPLTEEWLIKFGFEEALNGWWSPCEEYSYREGNFYLGANIFLAKIDYVHQLQNIYTVLQSREL